MPSLELNFLSDKPTEQDLLLQLIYGLCGELDNPKEEYNPCFETSFNFPNEFLRETLKKLVVKCNLPIPESRIDEWIEWHRTNQSWIVSEEMSDQAHKLTKVE